jgi:beta-xylosidase
MIAVTGLCGCPSNQPFTPNDGETLFRDDFDGALEEGWLLDGSPADVSLTDRDGFATLYPPSEIPEDEAAATTVLLRQIEGDFVLITQLDFQTITDLQSSGIVVQGNDGRTVLLGFSEIGQVGFRGALMVADRGPDVERGRALVRSDLGSVYLRLERSGDRFSGSFGPDGEQFTLVGSLTNDLSNSVRVGVGTLIIDACTSNCTAKEPAEFDYFEIQAPNR